MLRIFLIAFAVAAVSAYLLRSGSGPARQRGGHLVLEYSGVVKALSWVTLVVTILAVAGAAFWMREAQAEALSMLLVTSGVLPLAAAMVNEIRARVTLGEDRLSALSPWRGRVQIHWIDVVSVRYSKLLQWFVITGRHGEVIRVHNYMVGIGSLVESFERELDPLLFDEAKARYAKLIGRVS